MATKSSTEIAEVEEAEVVSDQGAAWSYVPASRAWDDVDQIDRVEGFDLEQNKMEMVGVPFIITKVTFREGAFRKAKEMVPDDYVSVECVTAPREYFDSRVTRARRRYADMGVPLETSVQPDENIVINDSSTGIKRQIVQYLHNRGIVTVAENLPRNFGDLAGASGENPLDAFTIGWAQGGEMARKGIEIRLLVKRGLRASKYENEYTPEGVTYYLA